MTGDQLFTPDFKALPYWWDRTPRPDLGQPALPAQADVVVVGSGYTGLNAALQTARGGRSTVVVDAEAAGWGCSTRNGGQVSTSVKPSLSELARDMARTRARASSPKAIARSPGSENSLRRRGSIAISASAAVFTQRTAPRQYEALARHIASPPTASTSAPISCRAPSSEGRSAPTSITAASSTAATRRSIPRAASRAAGARHRRRRDDRAALRRHGDRASAATAFAS